MEFLPSRNHLTILKKIVDWKSNIATTLGQSYMYMYSITKKGACGENTLLLLFFSEITEPSESKLMA